MWNNLIKKVFLWEAGVGIQIKTTNPSTVVVLAGNNQRNLKRKRQCRISITVRFTLPPFAFNTVKTQKQSITQKHQHIISNWCCWKKLAFVFACSTTPTIINKRKGSSSTTNICSTQLQYHVYTGLGLAETVLTESVQEISCHYFMELNPSLLKLYCITMNHTGCCMNPFQFSTALSDC